MSDTSGPAPNPQAAPPVAEAAPPGQPSTGGDLSNGRPAPRAIDREGAQAVLRQAYGRQREMQEGAPAEAPPEAPPRAAPAPPAPPPADGRDARGRFLPRPPGQQAQAAGAVDAPPKPAVEKTPTQAPPRSTPAATPDAPPAKPAAPPAQPGGRPADAPPSPAVPDEAASEGAPASPQDAPDALPEEFRTARWQRAFQAEAGLRTTVRRIRNNASLSEAQKTAQIAEKLRDGEQAADARDWREQQMRRLRDDNPQAYIAQLKADEAEAEAGNQLALRITQMIAEAYEVDAEDPDFLEAGPRDGDDRVEGLRRFVEYTSKKSPIFKTALTQALEAQGEAHAKEVEALKAQHKLDVEAALERGRSQARSPYGRNGAPPRSTGTGVVPVGQDEGPGGGPRVPAKAPTVAGIRDLIGMGYQQREPT